MKTGYKDYDKNSKKKLCKRLHDFGNYRRINLHLEEAI